MHNILVSAMLQSQQCWLPQIHEPLPFKQAVESAKQSQKLIAHCIEGNKKNLKEQITTSYQSHIMLIGPEGDFSKQEVEWALQHHFIPVSLGDTRLRAETAGIVAATLLMLG